MREIVPYWQSSDGMLTVYHAPYQDVLAAGLVPVRDVRLIHDDPPYGQGERTARGSAGRGRNKTSGTSLHGGRFVARQVAQASNFPAVVGDDRPYDPSPVLALQRPTVTWGAQRYADKLPASPSWLWWDKRDGVKSDDNGDGEIAWTNLGGPPRQFSHLWKGTCRASETGAVHLAPTQKPVVLSLWVFEDRAKLRPGDLVLVPHMGSGPDIPAIRAMRLRGILCDVEQWCCDTAIARLPEAPIEIVERAKAFQLSTRAAPSYAPLGPLFAGLEGT